MDIQQIPVAEALFRQWVKARGNKPSQATRDFIRSWHQIEDDPFFIGVTDSEVIRDLRDLAAAGWLKVVSDKYYSHRVSKVRLPLEMEEQWQAAFGFVRPDDSQIQLITSHCWSPKLQFLKGKNVSVPFSDLIELDRYLRFRRAGALPLAIKERSIEIFGDEKRLDELYRGSLLFQQGYLSLDDFNCYLVAEPLAWLRGEASDGPVIVLENAATFETYHRWDEIQPQFSAVVYGGGNRFSDSACRMDEVFQELGGMRETLYFGDLDAAGVRIPRIAADVFCSMGWPKLKPDLESYSKLIALSSNVPNLKQWDGPTKLAQKDLDWMVSLGSKAEELILKYGRIAQEWLSLERLLNDDIDFKKTPSNVDNNASP